MNFFKNKLSRNNKKLLLGLMIAATGFSFSTISTAAAAQQAPIPAKIQADINLPAGDMSNGADNFYKSKTVSGQQVTFHNIYNMKVAGNLFMPNNLDKSQKHPAIVVGHPMGAVKEQSANLYAQKMAEQGYVTISFDLSFWGDSEGQPRNSVSPDIYADDFSAAVDYLDTLPYVDSNNIGVIGICGSGSFAISEAKIDPRMKAIATVSMYDMGSANRNALHHSQTLAQRKAILKEASQERDKEYVGGQTAYTSGTPDTAEEATSPVAKEFYDFYRTSRGSVGDIKNHTTHPTLVSNVKFMNFYPFDDIETISPRPLLFIAGTEAHSLEFSEDAYKKANQPKELYLIKGAGHVDLYDRTDLIPFAKLTDFFNKYLH